MPQCDKPLVTLLTDPALALRRQMLVAGLFELAEEIQELEDGYAIKFCYGELLASRMADYILFESRSAPQLTFMIVIEPDCRTSWLHVRGPKNAKEHITEPACRLNPCQRAATTNRNVLVCCVGSPTN